MSTLGARRITDLEVTIPPAGSWIGRCRLDSGTPPAPGPVTLTLGDLKLVGAILPSRGGVDSPDHPAVVIAGGYGWRTPLTKASYASPSGVRLTSVIRDLAAIAGEAYDAPAEFKLGPLYGWDASSPLRTVRARAILADLVARGAFPMWRVAPSGHTRFDAWPTLGAADAHGTVEDRDLASGVRYVALSGSAAAWLPGATIQGSRIARVTFRERDNELKLTVWDA